MTNEFENMPTAPTLTLDPFQEEKQAPKPVEKQDPVMDDAILTPEEKQTVMQFAQQIDLTNSQMILQYGAGTQKKMADFSENALENVRTKDMGEIGELLTGVVKELKDFDSIRMRKRFLMILSLMKKRKKDFWDFSNVPAIK